MFFIYDYPLIKKPICQPKNDEIKERNQWFNIGLKPQPLFGSWERGWLEASYSENSQTDKKNIESVGAFKKEIKTWDGTSCLCTICK